MSEPSAGLARRMADRFEASRRSLLRGDFDVHGSGRRVVLGVSPDGSCKGSSAAQVLASAARILAGSGRCFRFGQSICFAQARDGEPRLEPIWEAGTMSRNAPALLTNLFVTSTGGEHPVESTPSPRLIAAVLSDERLHLELPRVRFRATRGCFDEDFCACRTGWNPDSGIFLEGPGLTPAPLGPVPASGAYLERLPGALARLIGEFAFRTDADAAGCVATLLTGLLINHFIEVPHPAILVDGNQPSVGKSLLVQVIGRVLDGLDPRLIPLGPDEELAKRLGAQLCDGRSGVFFFDNLRGPVDSPLLEASILAPTVSIRRLGQSALIERPNAFLFCFTSNGMSGTQDLLSRSLVIRLHCQGNAEQRQFARNPLDFAAAHRTEILGELAGMVERWCEAGRPDGDRTHRCGRWARVIGGILRANGLGEPFLANLQEARAEMDEDLQRLGDLALEALKEPAGTFWVEADADRAGAGRTPGDWVPLFERAGLLERRPAATDRSRATMVGKQLTAWATRGAETLLGQEADEAAAAEARPA